ncbi:hypothetical protein NEOLEDRAFT_1175248 [Neolentinus lepideus HHB14362 ss-1]|uniref:Uncharacterized protein n=1 Tax=Neolentinus lepideus HHB14362 ss-1 TaxID=1314782 RepID=A0A165VF10_9AGAM|nr:hypothetical protein NEOLEDRAFT_1175248 [Neolentinus lepideus HHB14362 ss-1]
MRPIHILVPLRSLHTSSLRPSTTVTRGGLDPAISQEHATSPYNRAPQTPQSAQVAAGLSARTPANDHHLDAASPNAQYRPRSFGRGGGNREGVGFVEQVGGASVSADNFSGVGYMGNKRGVHTSAARGGGSRVHTNIANRSPKVVLSMHVGADVCPLDAVASRNQAQVMGGGNKERVGFVEQVASRSRYMPDDEYVRLEDGQASGGLMKWEGASTVLGSVFQRTALHSSSQWEGHGRRTFFTSAHSSSAFETIHRSSPHVAGRTQKQKDAHLALDSGGAEEYEKAKLAGSRFGETGAQRGSVTVGEEAQREGRDGEGVSGDFSNSGVPKGKSG